MHVVQKEDDHRKLSPLRLMDTDGIPQGELLHFLPDEGHVALRGADIHLQWPGPGAEDGTRLAGHVTRSGVPGVEVSTGALGHGLSIACGMALASRRDQRRFRVFALLSDGECDEGATWEAALLAAHHRLDGLVAIVDYNKIQSLGAVKDVLDLEPLAAKWRAFGWAAREIDGHDVEAIGRTLSEIPLTPGRPTCVVAHTVKGKGVSFMENQLLWHYRAPDATEMARALAELDHAS